MLSISSILAGSSVRLEIAASGKLDGLGLLCRNLEKPLLISLVACPRTQRYQRVLPYRNGTIKIATVSPAHCVGTTQLLMDYQEAAADIEIPSAIRSAADLIGSFARWA